MFLGNDILEVDDGGIYRLKNPTGIPFWESVIGNLNLTEFYAVAWDSSPPGVILGGAQDVGVMEYCHRAGGGGAHCGTQGQSSPHPGVCAKVAWVNTSPYADFSWRLTGVRGGGVARRALTRTRGDDCQITLRSDKHGSQPLPVVCGPGGLDSLL